VQDLTDTDSDSDYLYHCYVPTADGLPTDTDVKDVTGACDYWTCTATASTVIPEHKTTDCTAFGDECNIYACDPAGARNNCSDITKSTSACTPDDTDNKCKSAICEDDTDTNNPAVCNTYVDTDTDIEPCNNKVCDPATGGWVYEPDTEAIANADSCDDADLCTIDDVCITGGGCAGSAKCLDTDSDACTGYTCNTSN
jgi:hypothetical protein